jgi:predicted ester cyclase
LYLHGDGTAEKEWLVRVEEGRMTLEDNKSLVQRFIDEVFNAGNTAAIADLCVPGSIFAGGIEGQVKSMKMGFPDNHFTIEDILAEGDKVAVRGTIHGTNTGPLVGLPAFGRLETPVPPTGKSVMVSGMNLFAVSEGKIVSLAAELDQIGLLRQLGWTFTPPDQQ